MRISDWSSDVCSSDLGHISVDAGAAKALAGGNSLLPAGVLTVAGEFARGDVVDIKDETGHVVARGLSEYDSVDAIKIIGCRSEEIARILGRSEEHTSELQSLMRISSAVFCLKTKHKSLPHHSQTTPSHQTHTNEHRR